ncbi:MAG: fibronectin type III domain-containing protein [Planctomycetota bacterium]
MKTIRMLAIVVLALVLVSNVRGQILTDPLEDFETGDFSKFPWEHSGDETWAVSSAEKNSGNYSAQAGSIEDDGSTTLWVSVDCIPGNISFYRKVSSEGGSDYLTFYIDGVQKDEWSGTEDWAEASFPVTAGTRIFKWTYSKDGSDTEGNDSAWIDDIVFPIEYAKCPLDAPVLHTAPNVTPALHNTISWDPVPGANRYFAECASDADFVNIVADSDWITETSHTFGNLPPGQKYWYRVKAGSTGTWLQTSQADFETDTLTGTRATSDGDVVLAGGSGSGGQVHVIENPSFESSGGWAMTANNNDLLSTTGIYPDDLWVSDGRRVGGTLFSDDFNYSAGDFIVLFQPVDWTGIETLMFDCCGIFARDLTMLVLIGETEVWSKRGTWNSMDLHMNQTVDVSAFSGHHMLGLVTEVNRSGSFLAASLWDNFRTSGPSGHAPLGKVVSTKIDLPAGCYWNVMEFDTTTPVGTELTVDVLHETGSSPIAGYANILSGTDLGGIIDTTIRLRANLSCSNPNVTPALHNWSVIHTKDLCESVWSNVVSFFLQ